MYSFVFTAALTSCAPSCVRVRLVVNRYARHVCSEIHIRPYIYSYMYVGAVQFSCLSTDGDPPRTMYLPPPLPPRLKNNYLLPTLRVGPFPRGGSSPCNFSYLITQRIHRNGPVRLMCHLPCHIQLPSPFI